MGLSTHAENKYVHNQTNDTHKNTRKFLVNLYPSKTPSIFSEETLFESSSNLFIFQVQEKYICRQNKTTKYNLSLQPRTPWKSCSLCLDFRAHLKLKICTIHIRLYGLSRIDYTDFFFCNFFQKLLLNGVQLTTFNAVRIVPSVVF